MYLYKKQLKESGSQNPEKNALKVFFEMALERDATEEAEDKEYEEGETLKIFDTFMSVQEEDFLS